MKKILLLTLCAVMLLTVTAAVKKTETDYSIAYVNDIQGECEIKKKSEGFLEELTDIYTPLYEGDALMTGKDGRIEIVFDDSTIIKMDPRSKLLVKNLKRGKKNSTLLELVKGTVMAVVKKLTTDEEFAVKTKMAMAAVKGTEFIVETEGEDNDKVAVYEGAVAVSSYDMSGKELHKLVLDKDKETLITKKLRQPERPRPINKNFVKRYKEIKDIREKIQYVREMRRQGKHKELRLKRQLERINNIKKMRGSPGFEKSLNSKQKAVLDAIESREQYYRDQLDELERKERKGGSRVKLYLENKKSGIKGDGAE